MTAGAVAAPLIIPIMHQQTPRTKNHIDTSTHVCMHSDTPGVLIFYTVDGSRPAPPQRGGASGASRKYSEPILLPAGRVAVRAVASTGDGRESSMVTKVFSVQLASEAEPEPPQPGVEGVRRSVVSAGPDRVPAGHDRVPAGPDRVPAGSPEVDQSCSLQRLPASAQQLSSTETTRIQRETDFLRCSQCLSLRPSDPLAAFCSQCGSAVPPLPNCRLPPAEGGQMVSCVFCNSVVPVNTQTCVICEASLHQQLLPQSSLRLQGRVVCVTCGRRNPAHIKSCLTCESNLHPEADGAPCVPSADYRASCCSGCERVNRADARFCDWCGCKRQPAGGTGTCRRCGARGRADAFYCALCGAAAAPAPPTPRDVIPPAEKTLAEKQAPPRSEARCDATLAPPPPTTDRHTQTVGLYYPSATELHRKEQQRALQLARRQETRPQTPLSAVSPGRGYWRKQLDHVCAHLRSYTHNNAPFRALLGEPRLGRVTSAVIREDAHEVSVTLGFVRAAANQKQVEAEEAEAGAAPSAGRTDSLSSVTERAPRKKRPAGKPPPQEVTSDPSLSPPQGGDGPLLEELGPGSGRGQLSALQEILDQGADPRRCGSGSGSGSGGRHPLAVAVINGHHHALPVLVQRGADLDQQSGQMKNTALHEAVALGAAGLQSAAFLLSCGAGVTERNAAGETAYDVAVRCDCSSMVSLLASHTGRRLLGRLGKPNLDLV